MLDFLPLCCFLFYLLSLQHCTRITSTQSIAIDHILADNIFIRSHSNTWHASLTNGCSENQRRIIIRRAEQQLLCAACSGRPRHTARVGTCLSRVASTVRLQPNSPQGRFPTPLLPPTFRPAKRGMCPMRSQRGVESSGLAWRSVASWPTAAHPRRTCAR